MCKGSPAWPVPRCSFPSHLTRLHSFPILPWATPYLPEFPYWSQYPSPFVPHSCLQEPWADLGSTGWAFVPAAAPLEHILRCGLPSSRFVFGKKKKFTWPVSSSFPLQLSGSFWKESSMLLYYHFDGLSRGKVGKMYAWFPAFKWHALGLWFLFLSATRQKTMPLKELAFGSPQTWMWV